MKTLKLKRRALVLATAGLLAGSALSLATHGRLQPAVEIPVQITEDLSAGTFPVELKEKPLLVQQVIDHKAELLLFLTGETYAKLEHLQTVTVRTSRWVDIDILSDNELALISQTVAKVHLAKANLEKLRQEQNKKATEALIMFALNFDEIMGDNERNT